MTEGSIKRILVVDDEQDVRDYLSAALKDAGFDVETAADGAQAMECVRRCAPDLISLDLVMPKHSGARFYRDLQKDKELAKIPVLIVTGHARDDVGKADFEELTMSGPGVYLEKPVRPSSYVAAVSRMLGVESAEPGGAPDSLREEVSRMLSGASRDALQRALEALKKK